MRDLRELVVLAETPGRGSGGRVLTVAGEDYWGVAVRRPRSRCGLEVVGVQLLDTAGSPADPVVDPLAAGGGAP
jgi:hypothetical protein